MGVYDFKKLLKAAKENPSEESLMTLGEWLEEYGQICWNGESYDLGDGSRLRPIKVPDVIDDDGTVLQWRVDSWEMMP